VALKSRAYAQFFGLALQLVREVAIKELDNTEKRKWVVEEAYKAAPLWATKMVTKLQVEQIAEQAYQLLRGELKQK
jgi:hypothetical protein